MAAGRAKVRILKGYIIACFIIPLFGYSISLQLIPIQILILKCFAEKIKFLAITEVRPNFTSSSAKKYKGFSNFIKGKNFRRVLLIF
jgi:hypothetical protein